MCLNRYTCTSISLHRDIFCSLLFHLSVLMKRQKEYIFLHDNVFAKTFTYSYSVCQCIVLFVELIYLY